MNLRKAAEEHGIPFKQAAWYRVCYLRERVKEITADIERFVSLADQAETIVDAAFATSCCRDSLFDLSAAAKELHTLTKTINGHEQKQSITDEQIEAARRYPINQVIDFHRGKATAWCHEDKNPSLYHGTRHNIAVCPVCDRKFDPIAVLMEREGMTFIDAVKQLAP